MNSQSIYELEKHNFPESQMEIKSYSGQRTLAVLKTGNSVEYEERVLRYRKGQYTVGLGCMTDQR